jgi:hypothetical protein
MPKPKPNAPSEQLPVNPNQPPARIIDNQPAKTVKQALDNGKRQIEEANAE